MRGAPSVPGDFTTQVTVRQGQTLEVQLGAAFGWGVEAGASDGVLRAEAPPSWYDAARAICVWRYTAVGRGMTRLSFAGGPVCPPRSACPAIAAIVQYAITVQ